MSTAQEARTNDRVIDLTTRRRPALAHLVPFTPDEPDAALTLRWVEHLLNEPYYFLDIYISSERGQFGTEILKAARVAASTAMEPPRLN